ncbi:caspase family protein [Nocardia sp. NPDC050710]|uniref:caspase family protein n=1 Tax=Nocardia sp. NPDC050710 TaxID=3157220 RepID=UPI0033CB255C
MTVKSYRRAAICIGVDVVSPLTPLRAAASGASTVAGWAERQGCDVVLHTDIQGGAHRNVTRRQILQSIGDFVDKRVYSQLIVYFAGHGVLMAPGAEVWLLSEAGTDSTEAVNALLSAEHARRAGIPHVVLISDACRSYVNGPPFFGLTGGSIFPQAGSSADSAELDIYFGTAPGNPAYEVKAQPGDSYGVFTRCLLDLLTDPPGEAVEYIELGRSKASEKLVRQSLPVVTSRRLKRPLIEAVRESSARLDPLFDQRPEIRVETDLPQYIAALDVAAESAPPRRTTPDTGSARTDDSNPTQLSSLPESAQNLCETSRAADELASRQVDHHGSAWIVARGARIDAVEAVGWEIAEQHHSRGVHAVELIPAFGHAFHPASAVLRFEDGTGTVVGIEPNMSMAVYVDGGRIAGMDYRRRDEYYRRQFSPNANELSNEFRDQYLAFANSESQNGRIDILLDDRLFRQATDSGPWGHSTAGTGDVILGTLRGYAEAERGTFDPAHYFEAARSGVISFDIALLASQMRPHGTVDMGREVLGALASHRIYPFTPLSTRGWLLLDESGPLWRPYHRDLARHLIPALWTTLDNDGVLQAFDTMYQQVDT